MMALTISYFGKKKFRFLTVIIICSLCSYHLQEILIESQVRTYVPVHYYDQCPHVLIVKSCEMRKILVEKINIG